MSWNFKPVASSKPVQRLKTRHKILIADDDMTFARRLSDYLWDHGFESKVTNLVSEAKDIVEFWAPDTIFVDMMLPETNALALFKFINTRNLKKKPKVIVMSKQALPQGVETMRKAGASHYLVKPFSLEDAFLALGIHQPPPQTPAPEPAPHVQIKELHLVNLFLRQAMLGVGEHSGLHNLMCMVNIKVKALRTSFIQCLDHQTAAVLAANDDENIQGRPLQIDKYPELREVRRTQRLVVIPNVRTSDILAPVQKTLSQTPFETILLFPVFRNKAFFGVMSVRMEQKSELEIHYAEKFGQVCSQIISLAIGTPGQSLVA